MIGLNDVLEITAVGRCLFNYNRLELLLYFFTFVLSYHLPKESSPTSSNSRSRIWAPLETLRMLCFSGLSLYTKLLDCSSFDSSIVDLRKKYLKWLSIKYFLRSSLTSGSKLVHDLNALIDVGHFSVRNAALPSINQASYFITQHLKLYIKMINLIYNWSNLDVNTCIGFISRDFSKLTIASSYFISDRKI